MARDQVSRRRPKYGWIGAFGLMVTILWLYVEFLRIFALLNGRNN